MRREFQVKTRTTLPVSKFLELGAEPLGKTIQNDIYLGGKNMWRIREEGSQQILTQKGQLLGSRSCIKEVAEITIGSVEVKNLIRQRGIVCVIDKTRTLFLLQDCVISIDVVEHLGCFMEFRASNEDKIFNVLSTLGISESEVISESYLDLMTKQGLPPWLFFLLRIHRHIGELSFGITSGIMTSMGILVGMTSANSGKFSIIAAISVIGAADSLSDSFGIYLSKLAERGCSKKKAIRSAVSTLVGKAGFALTLILVILFFPPDISLEIGICWGLLLLTLFNTELAIVSQESVPKALFQNISLAIAIILISYVVGNFVGSMEP